MILSIPYYLIYWSFLGSFFNNWTSSGVYFYNFLNRDGSAAIYMIAALVGLFLLFAKKPEASMLREIAAYTAGMMFTLGIYDTLVSESWYGLLELFIIPFNRISLFLLLSVLLNRASLGRDWKRYLWIGISLIIPFILNLIPQLASFNKTGAALILSIIVLIISFIVFITESREPFPE
ncbi:hypothetical protein [Spirochaeta isovalerica]|nr:hypothetical protein [Spirochaeta isovalerica]